MGGSSYGSSQHEYSKRPRTKAAGDSFSHRRTQPKCRNNQTIEGAGNGIRLSRGCNALSSLMEHLDADDEKTIGESKGGTSMSTLEKTIGLLETMPDDKIKTVYAFAQFIDSYTDEAPTKPTAKKAETIQSMLGIAHEYANPALIDQEEGAFERAIAEKYAADRC